MLHTNAIDALQERWSISVHRYVNGKDESISGKIQLPFRSAGCLDRRKRDRQAALIQKPAKVINETILAA